MANEPQRAVTDGDPRAGTREEAMYPGLQAKIRPQQPAFIMAQSGEAVTYAELERRSNRLAHFLRASGLGRLDHYAIFMENNARCVECCSAGERAGLYYTCVNSYLTPDEVAYILDNSESKILITSAAKRDVALQTVVQCPRIERCLVVDGPVAAPGWPISTRPQADFLTPPSPTNPSAPRCSIRQVRRAAQRGSCGPWLRARRRRTCRSSISLWMLGALATA
jgi:acyl-CoA synthetase (AMP-forming)/AMP-acid ligase II